MFKISEFKNVNYEKINIDTFEENNYQSLHFEIIGQIDDNNYLLNIYLNNDIKEFLNYKKSEKYNINNLICESEIEINNKYMEISYLDFQIIRYLDNKFTAKIMMLIENDNFLEERYAILIEFDFNLDDYLGKDNEIN